jgi:hypothetical protein
MDSVNKPQHYTQGGIECIEAIRASLSPSAFQGYCKGNVMKYLWRYEHKGKPAEDLKKAQVYMNWMIESVEQEAIARKKAETEELLRIFESKPDKSFSKFVGGIDPVSPPPGASHNIPGQLGPIGENGPVESFVAPYRDPVVLEQKNTRTNPEMYAKSPQKIKTPDEWMNFIPEGLPCDLKDGSRTVVIVNDGVQVTASITKDGKTEKKLFTCQEFYDQIKW